MFSPSNWMSSVACPIHVRVGSMRFCWRKAGLFLASGKRIGSGFSPFHHHLSRSEKGLLMGKKLGKERKRSCPAHAFSTKLSSTFFTPVSKAISSLSPSTERTRPYPNLV